MRAGERRSPEQEAEGGEQDGGGAAVEAAVLRIGGRPVGRGRSNNKHGDSANPRDMNESFDSHLCRESRHLRRSDPALQTGESDLTWLGASTQTIDSRCYGCPNAPRTKL